MFKGAELTTEYGTINFWTLCPEAKRVLLCIPLAEKTVGTEQDKGIRQYADAPAERVSLKAKLEVMKAKVAGEDIEKPMPQKARGKEETL